MALLRKSLAAQLLQRLASGLQTWPWQLTCKEETWAKFEQRMLLCNGIENKQRPQLDFSNLGFEDRSAAHSIYTWNRRAWRLTLSWKTTVIFKTMIFWCPKYCIFDDVKSFFWGSYIISRSVSAPAPVNPCPTMTMAASCPLPAAATNCRSRSYQVANQ